MKLEKTEEGHTVLRVNWIALITILGTLGGSAVWIGSAVYQVGAQVTKFQSSQNELKAQVGRLEGTVARTAADQKANDARQDDRIDANSGRIRQVEISTASTATSVAQIASDMKDIKSLLYEALRKGELQR
ncbi:hypothetical protein [Acidimangrovimonas sediminis]|uniref:hypothetical protein n=1 Tax=Acidimangrovimonas sediminis TaxID=2056283 RepID=UPI000C80C8EA|nr:hypothetical protein [Acidimangrovimonas sediminis]